MSYDQKRKTLPPPKRHRSFLYKGFKITLVRYPIRAFKHGWEVELVDKTMTRVTKKIGVLSHRNYQEKDHARCFAMDEVEMIHYGYLPWRRHVHAK